MPRDAKVWVFGSRAKWTTKDSSDLDLAVDAGRPLTRQEMNQLEDAFEESDLPYKVDVVDMHRVSDSFKTIIERDKVTLPLNLSTMSSMDEWTKLSLREAGVSLIDCDHRTPPASNDGYPYVTIPHIKRGRIDLTEVRRITHDHFVEWTCKANPQPYDVVLSRRCNPGETAFVPPDLQFAVGQNLVLLRSDGTKIFQPFLRWLVRGPEWWEQVDKFINVGAVFDSLKCADIPNFRLSIPPVLEQYEISSLLGALDDKIELNRQMNETLEAMARLFFKDWFVDFGPTRAKAEGRPPYLTPELWALFPDVLDDDDKPMGWEKYSLSDVTERITKGTTPTQSEIDTAGKEQPKANFVKVNSITDRGSIVWDKLETIPYSIHGESLKRFILIEGDVLYTIAGTIGRVSIVEKEILPANTNQAVAIIRPDNEKVPSRFLYMLLSSRFFQEELHMNVVHAVQANLSLTALSNSTFISPPLQALCSLFEINKSLFSAIDENNKESRNLESIRDLLLPKLMSGEIRLRDAEKMVEEVL